MDSVAVDRVDDGGVDSVRLWMGWRGWCGVDGVAMNGTVWMAWPWMVWPWMGQCGWCGRGWDGVDGTHTALSGGWVLTLTPRLWGCPAVGLKWVEA